jgi:hypothetical protein
MRFLVDECTGPSVAQWLRELHHEVFSVYDKALKKVLELYSDELLNNFTVVTEKTVRIIEMNDVNSNI